MTLSEYLIEHDLTHAAFAQLIGSSQASVSRYAVGARLPTRAVMNRIVEVTNGQVGPNGFYTPASTKTAEATWLPVGEFTASHGSLVFMAYNNTLDRSVRIEQVIWLKPGHVRAINRTSLPINPEQLNICLSGNEKFYNLPTPNL